MSMFAGLDVGGKLYLVACHRDSLSLADAHVFRDPHGGKVTEDGA